MYTNYWKIAEKPFENTPDPRFMYNSAQHEEAFSRMLYVIRESKGAGLLTGVFGCGKTMLGRAITKELENDVYKVAYIVNPRLEELDLLRMLAHYLGADNLPERKSDIIIAIERILINNYQDGKKTIAVFDEAHAIEQKSVFEEIRLLLNFQADDKFLITILLFGQPELKEKVESNKQLLQRIAMKYHLEGLTHEDVKNYIRHRLDVAGGQHIDFSETSVKMIFDRTGGIPRRINQICDMCLLTGFFKKREKIDDAIVREAIDSIEG